MSGQHTITIPGIGNVDLERFTYEIGSCLLRLPKVAKELGHSTLFGCINDYIHPLEDMTPEEKAAILFVKDFVRNKSEEMLEKWYPGA